MIPTERDDEYTTLAFVEGWKDGLIDCYRSTQASGRYAGKSVPGLTNRSGKVSELLWTEALEEIPLFCIVHK